TTPFSTSKRLTLPRRDAPAWPALAQTTRRTTMKARMNLRRTALALLCCCALSDPMAAVVVNGTRVVVDAATGEATVHLRNSGNQPVLVQAWIDQGDAKAEPTQAGSPFVLTPPVARIDAGQGQALRLIRAGDIAHDARESLYWLNI